jgi:hypothetical protein
MPSDSSDVDNALVAKLGADSTLLALMPNGVYWDEAPQGSTRFVIVSLVDERDTAMFGSGHSKMRSISWKPGRSRRVAAT